MLDELELSNDHAEAIVDQAIIYEVVEESDKAKSKKDLQEQAHEIVTFSIDSWINDGINPDNEDADEETVEQVQQILNLAGIEIDDEEVTYGDLPELEEAEDEDEEDEGDDDDDESDEAPFDVNDIIEDYEDQKVADIIKAFESGDLTSEQIAAVQEHEENEGARARILKFDADSVEAEDDEEDEDEEEGDEDEIDLDALDRKELKALIKENELDISVKKSMEDDDIRNAIRELLGEEEDEEEEEPDEEDEDEGEELEEPLEGYGSAKVSDIKAAITEAAESDEGLDADTVQEIVAYEEANKNRATLIKWLNELTEGEDESEDDEEAGDAVDDAVARDDEKDRRKSKKKSNGKAADIDLDDDEIVELLPKGLARTFVRTQLDEARKEIEARGLQVPSDYEGEEPQLPDDIAEVDHEQLSQLLLDFQAAHSTAIWNAAFNYVWANTYEEISDYVNALALQDADGKNKEERLAEVATEGKVVFFKAKQRQFHNSYVLWRDLAKTYDGKGRVISRIGGFVDEDHDNEVRSARKSSTAGKAKGNTKGTAKKKSTGKVALKS